MKRTNLCPHGPYILVGERMPGGRKKGESKDKEKKFTDSNNCIDENKTGHFNRVMGGGGDGGRGGLASLDWEIRDGLSEEATFGMRLE